MKITDVKVTVWEWKDIPPTRYTLQAKSAANRSAHMALVKIITDEGIEGHAFFRLPTALQLASALKEIRPFWLEDFLGRV